MPIHFKDDDALRNFTHVYFKDGANLRQAKQVYFKDGDNLRKVYDVSIPGAVPFSINTIGLRVTVSWTPAPNNGFPISMYGLRYRDTDDAAWTEMSLAGTVREWTTPTLTLNEEYEFQMRAQNELGWNAWSTSQTATITQAAPAKPRAPVLRRRQSGEINASWTAPNANGAVITAYQLQYKLSTAAGWTTASSTITRTNYTVTGLTNGLTYNFRVRARNLGGWSQYSDTSSLAPANPATAPGAPTWGNFTTATRSITVRWTAPSSNGGSAITGYQIEYRRGTSGSWTDGPDPGVNATSRTISGLIPNTSYQFRIRAINGVGNGTWSSNKSGTTRKLVTPDPIRITTSQTWNVPNDWNEVTSMSFMVVGGDGGGGGGGGTPGFRATVVNTAGRARVRLGQNGSAGKAGGSTTVTKDGTSWLATGGPGGGGGGRGGSPIGVSGTSISTPGRNGTNAGDGTGGDGGDGGTGPTITITYGDPGVIRFTSSPGGDGGDGGSGSSITRTTTTVNSGDDYVIVIGNGGAGGTGGSGGNSGSSGSFNPNGNPGDPGSAGTPGYVLITPSVS